MDNLTHGLAGALLAQAGVRQRYGRAASVALIVGSELPDLDALFDLAGPIIGFQQHRGVTHAFAGGLGLALLVAAVLYGLLRYRHYWRLVGVLYAGVLLHIWMDYLTSYGTQILLPFDAGRYTADAVFIIDFFYTGIIVAALLSLRMVRLQRYTRYRMGSWLAALVGVVLWFATPWLVQHPLWRQLLGGLGRHIALFALLIVLASCMTRSWPTEGSLRIGRYGVGALAAYMVLCMVNQQVAKQRFTAALGAQMAQVKQVSAIPLPGGPLAWRGIAETASSYLVSRISLLSGEITAPRHIPKGLEQEEVRRTHDYQLVRVFRDFARFPVVEYYRQGQEDIVRYTDLRFVGYGRETSWFDLKVRFDKTGQVRMIEFLNHVFLPSYPGFKHP
ncbi:MAG: metal-dependent hydrolase [bacterium]|nr:metal-dependent hydrolase [bacterium]